MIPTIKWSFDDYFIGPLRADGGNLRERVLARSPVMGQQEWYKLAGEICHYLNQGLVTQPS